MRGFFMRYLLSLLLFLPALLQAAPTSFGGGGIICSTEDTFVGKHGGVMGCFASPEGVGVMAPGSSVAHNFMSFADTSGTVAEDSGLATADFCHAAGNETIAGQKTFSSAPIFSANTANTVPYLSAGKVFTSSSVTSTELGWLSGVTSAIQTQLNAKAGSGANSNITSMSGLTGPLVSPTYGDFVQIAKPASPAATHNRLYFKSDDHLYELASDGTETQVDGGGGGIGAQTANRVLLTDGAGAATTSVNITAASGNIYAYGGYFASASHVTSPATFAPGTGEFGLSFWMNYDDNATSHFQCMVCTDTASFSGTVAYVRVDDSTSGSRPNKVQIGTLRRTQI
jgi:hypothetical protein